MAQNYYKTEDQSNSDIGSIIRLMIGKDIISNLIITDINSNIYNAINGELQGEGIEINKGMESSELEHDFLIPYLDIKKIEDRLSKKVIYEKLD